MRHPAPRKAVLGLAAAAVAASGLAATASPAQAAGGDDFTATAHAEILHVNAVGGVPGLLSVADLAVAEADGSVNSSRASRVVSEANNLGGDGLLGLPLGGLLGSAKSTATDADPNPARVTNTTLPLNIPFLLDLAVSDANAKSTWSATNVCGFGSRVLSASGVKTAEATLAPLELPGLGGTNLLSLSAAEAVQATALTAQGDGTASVKSTASTSTVDLTLLGDSVGIEVLSPPTLTATATGKPGGAKVDYSPAIIRVTGPDGNPMTLPLDGESVNVAIPENPLLNISLQTPGVSEVSKSADGKSASAQAQTLGLKVALGPLTIADVDLLPLSVSATAPTGGVECNGGGSDWANPSDPKADPDGDGLSNEEEERLGTDPTKADTDGGGVSDGAEAANGTDPKNPADDFPALPSLDADGDGLTDEEERQRGTDPKKADTDGDGLGDGIEVRTRTNPKKADTDGDGLRDGVEVFGDANTRYGHAPTNPRVKDSDGDGLTDAQEVKGVKMTQKVRLKGKKAKAIGLVRTNPNRADTDRDGLKDGAEVKGIKMNVKVKRAKKKGGNYTIRVVRTNPLVKDTDRDGIADRVEVKGYKVKAGKRKSDPTNWDTDFGGVSDGKERKNRTDPTRGAGSR